jgi:hypothetical protein
MAIAKRYRRDTLIRGQSQYGTAKSSQAIYRAVQSGALRAERYVLTGVQRLDILAGQRYGDANLWWVIAAASRIGWALQCPAGTVLYIPTDIGKVRALVG